MLYKKNHVELILWDWNGTLLNDQTICIDAMNRLLVKRGLPLLTEEKYRRVFTFPVKTYYAQLGFDFAKEPFEIPALEFMEQYHVNYFLKQSYFLRQIRYSDNFSNWVTGN